MTLRPLATALMLAFVGAALTACPGHNPDISPADPGTGSPETMVGAARWDDRPDGGNWTGYVLAALDQFGAGLVATVPQDIAAYCPRYPTAGTAERKAFWVGLLSALTKWESSYNPSTSYTENFDDARGNPVISRGLLQISIESGRGYGCAIANDQALHDPNVNLTCGVRIFNRLVSRDRIIGSEAEPWKGAAAYWSPFRVASKRTDMRSWTAAQAYCKL